MRMLFLGAGASNAFDIPTMTTFVDDVLKSLPSDKQEWKDEILNLKERSEKKNQRFDIEILLTALTILSDTAILKNYLTPFLAIFDTEIQIKPDLAPLASDIRKQIFRKCMKFNGEKASEIYGKLCNHLNENNVYRVVFDKKEGGERLKDLLPPITHKVSTTNYDPVYETSLKLNDVDYCDGFIVDRQELVFGDIWDDNKVQLAKLHGSMDYYLMERTEVVAKHSLPTNENETDIFGDKLKQRMMILPIGEKYVTRTPYLQLLQKLRRDLFNEEIVVVIGYSFRDDPVNNAFIERISRKGRIKIIVVAPDATNIIRNNLPISFQRFSVPVDMYFGDDASIEGIHDAVVDRACGDGF